MKRRTFLSSVIAMTTVTAVSSVATMPSLPVYEQAIRHPNHSRTNLDGSISFGNFPGWEPGTRFYRTGECLHTKHLGSLEKHVRVDTGESRWQISSPNPKESKCSFYSDEPFSQNWWRRVA